MKKCKEYEKVIKFGIVGVLNVFVSWIIFFFLIKLGLYYLLANIISYFAGMLNSFVLNKKYVFKEKKYSIRVLLKFVFFNIVALLCSTGGLFLLKEYIKMSPLNAQVTLTVIFFFINYMISKRIVFKK